MIVSGNLSVEEASQLRRLIMDNMVAVTGIPSDIHEKRDFDMLKELHRTLDKRKRFDIPYLDLINLALTPLLF